MAININWGEVLKAAGPTLGGMAAAKAGNRGFETATNITTAAAEEEAAKNRARAAVEAGTLDLARQKEAREAAAQAVRDSQTAALMKNMQDVRFADVGKFRSKVPELHFTGGSRPSAFGAEGQQLAEVMQNRAMQTLMTPQGGGGGGGGSEAVGRNQGAMPDYKPADIPEEGFWEKALGIAGLGTTIAGAAFPKAAGAAAAPSVAAQVAKGGVPGLPLSKVNTSAVTGLRPSGIPGGAVNASTLFGAGAPGSLLAGTPGVSAAQLFGGAAAPSATGLLAGTPGVTGAQLFGTAPSAAMAGGKTGGNALMRVLGGSTGGASGALGAANMIAGPAGMAAGFISPYLPAGQPRDIADFASKGAMIGSFFPGAGTAIGAGIGAGVGAIKGHQNATIGDRKDLAKRLGYGNLDLLYKALEGMGPEGMKLRQQGLNVIGKHDVKGNELWKQQVTNLLGRR